MATAHFNSTFQFNSRFTERFFASLPSSVSFPHPTFSSSSSSISLDALPPFPILKSRVFRVFAVAEEEPLSITASVEGDLDTSPKSQLKPCQLYVCNLPRSCDMSQLLDMFKPYGTVQSVEILRNTETGISKGCGYVTMSSMGEAIAAVIALDVSDVGGREMRVKLSEDMNKKKNIEVLNAITNRNLIFETPHKVYVGNLAWSIKPDFLREHFTQFGNVVSVRVLYDRKTGKNRVYAFLSFSSDEELKAAISADGTELLGRKMVVRNALSSEPEPK